MPIDPTTIILGIGIPAVLALLTPLLTARVKVKIDAKNRERAIDRLERDPLIKIGVFFTRIDFPNGAPSIGPCYISSIDDTYVQVVEWKTGDSTTFDGHELSSVQYWALMDPQKGCLEVCLLGTHSEYIKKRFGKPGPPPLPKKRTTRTRSKVTQVIDKARTGTKKK